MSRENISIARAKFRNRTLLQVMETRYLLRNKILEENTRIFGPPMTKHINLTKFAFCPMKISVSEATSCVRIMNFSIGEIDMSMSFKL